MKTITVIFGLLLVTLTIAAQPSQCGVIKKTDGKPCKQPVKKPGDACYHHDTTIDVPRCGAPKSKTGLPCRNKVDKPGERCRYHPEKVALYRATDCRGLISVVYRINCEERALDYIKPRKFRRMFN